MTFTLMLVSVSKHSEGMTPPCTISDWLLTLTPTHSPCLNLTNTSTEGNKYKPNQRHNKAGHSFATLGKESWCPPQ